MTYAQRRARMRPRPFDLESLAAVADIRLGLLGPAVVDEDTLTGAMAEWLGVGARHVKRMRQQGLRTAQADQFGLRLGYHPPHIWPAWAREPEPAAPELPARLVKS